MNSTPRSVADLVIFLHIPKTAGTTLWSILEKQYGAQQRRLKYGGITENNNKVRELLANSEAEKLKLVGSHIPFGAHEMTARTTSYFTLMRDPIKWVCSTYYKILRKKTHSLHEKVALGNLTINQAIPLIEDNIQTRMLAGMSDLNWNDPEVPPPPCLPVHLEKARVVLKNNIDVMGLTERFDESLILLQRFYGWKTPFYSRKNVGSNVKASQPPETIELIRARNAFDTELYEFAKELFEEEIERFGRERLKREVSRFHLKNKIAGHLSIVRGKFRSLGGQP